MNKLRKALGRIYCYFMGHRATGTYLGNASNEQLIKIKCRRCDAPFTPRAVSVKPRRQNP